MISLELFGDPVPQTRPRFSRQNNSVRTYDPLLKLKEGYKWQLASQFREEVLKGPIALDVLFYMPIPKSTSKVKQRQMENGVIAHTKKPDVDNLVKLVLDCMNKTIFEDDSQISDLRIKKIYSSKPGTLIRIFPLGDAKRNMLYENCNRELPERGTS